MPADQRLRTIERLKSRTAIGELFGRRGEAEVFSVKAYPLRLVYRLLPVDDGVDGEGPHARLGFVAPKRAFRRAVDRNFVKRRMREAFRLGKGDLYAGLLRDGRRLEGMLLFTGRDLPTQAHVHSAWRKLLRRLPAQH